MRVFAIGDLHLAYGVEKPMDLFGEQWIDHPRQIREQWVKSVGDEDVVLIPGDISWAMHLADALPDFAFIDALPGKKIVLRGNHDYWWSSLAKVARALPPSITAVQNTAVKLDGLWVGGTRGWCLPDSAVPDAEDEKIYARELGRLKLSLDNMANDGADRLVMTHFPPFGERNGESAFTRLFEQYRVGTVVYGHLHGPAAHKGAFEGVRNGVNYLLVAADYLGFAPKRVR